MPASVVPPRHLLNLGWRCRPGKQARQDHRLSASVASPAFRARCSSTLTIQHPCCSGIWELIKDRRSPRISYELLQDPFRPFCISLLLLRRFITRIPPNLHPLSNCNMSGPGVGFEYPPKEVSWLKRDALLFATSIGCTADELHFLYV